MRLDDFRAIAVLLALGACDAGRAPAAPPSWDEGVSAVFASKCSSCHGPDAATAAAGWRADSYLDAIACTRDGAPVVLPPNDTAPVLRALADPTHPPVPLSSDERAAIAAWVDAGAPKGPPGVHDPSFVDPRSPGFHGAALRAARWRPMLDATDPGACARCHDGAPSPRPSGVTTSAPDAPACTTCHSQPGGALACGTCHGDGANAFPPRDPCFFPGDAARAGAHAAHAGPSAVRAVGLPCATCHPSPDATDPANVMTGTHGDGAVEIAFDPALAGPNAAYDATTGACTTTCHARAGGARPAVAWHDTGPLGCGDCHGSPPPSHYAGACSDCHAEANANGTALLHPTLHVNGKVDLGDGSNTCGACHGSAGTAWPTTNAHGSHRAPSAADAVPCETCHVVPTAFGAGTGHPRGGPAVVTFSGRALGSGATPAYAPDTATCAMTYCHGDAKPVWTDTSGKSKACGSCHGIPPPPPHIGGSPPCETCHSPVVTSTPSGPMIVPSEASLHVDGQVERGP